MNVMFQLTQRSHQPRKDTKFSFVRFSSVIHAKILVEFLMSFAHFDSLRDKRRILRVTFVIFAARLLKQSQKKVDHVGVNRVEWENAFMI